MVAYLHFIQPLARVRGRIRGVAVAAGDRRCRAAEPQTSRGPRPSLAEAWRALLLLSGTVTEDRFWSETWTSADRVLVAAHRLAAPVARGARDRDRRGLVGRSRRQRSVGRWAWLDVRALVEEHGGGKTLLRVSTHLRPTMFGVVERAGAGRRAARRGGRRRGVAMPAGGRHHRRRDASASSRSRCGARRRRRRSCGAASPRVTVGQGMVAMPSGPARAPLIAPSLLRTYGLRSAIDLRRHDLSLGAGTFMLREAATMLGHRRRRRGTPATTDRRSRPGSTRRAASSSTPNGDIYFADSNNDVIRRIRRAQQRTSSRSPATTTRAADSPATTDRRSARSSTRRTASRSRRTAI